MSDNKLQFKIVKDSLNSDIELGNMSLIASKAFLKLLEALTKIVELTPDHNDIKLQITRGSAVVSASGTAEQITEIKDEFDRIKSFTSTNEEVIKPWREIQNLVCNNGLHYEINFIKNSEIITITDDLKSKRRFKAKSTKRVYESSVSFVSGKLIEIGGKKPNFHVVNTEGLELVIACTEDQAKHVNRFLYNQIFASVWLKEANGKKIMTFCDLYASEESFNEYSNLNNLLENAETESDLLSQLHEILYSLINDQDFGKLRKFLRLFLHESTNINILKTILVVTKGLRNHNEFHDTRLKIKEFLEERVSSKFNIF